MDNRPPPLKLNIDPQKDFNPAAADALSRDKIKDYLKDINYDALLKNIPSKNHREPIIKFPLLPMDESGSMGSILGHELPHGTIYKAGKIKEIYEKDYSAYEKKIIIFDEMEKGGEAFSKKISEYFNDVVGILDIYQTSQARGEELAEGFHAGVAQPVAVRRPLSFRARVGATA